LEIENLGKEIASKDQEMLTQEETNLKLTEELHTLKEKLLHYEASGDTHVQKIQELQMEI
jgi:hypothetical protein